MVIGKKPTPKVTNDEFEALKTEFQESLSKLSNNDTKKVGLEKCQNIISHNVESVHLRMYLSQLCMQMNTVKVQKNKELQVLLLGHVAIIFKTGMCDPIDKPPSIFKTISRVCDQI
jgi:hypothetical protein